MDHFWDPQAIPTVSNRFWRWLLAVHLLYDYTGAALSEHRLVDLWKSYVLCRVDYIGCAFLFLGVSILFFVDWCIGKKPLSHSKFVFEMLACLFFLTYSSHEKREAKSVFK